MKSSITNAKKTIYTLLGLVLLVFLWFIASATVGLSLLLPSPAETLKRLMTILGEKGTYLCIGNTMLSVTAGIIVGITVAVILSLGVGFSEKAERVFSPAEHIIRVTPVASFIILALVWIRSERICVLISALMVFPVVYRSTVTAIRNRNPQLIEMAKIYGVGKVRIFRAVVLPSVMPHFISSVATAVGLGWKAGIAAEVLCAPKNTIGRMLYDSKIYLETTDLFAWTVIVIVLSLIMEFIISLLKKKDGV